MADTVGSFMLKRLRSLGVQRIYGYPGDGITGLLGAFHEVGDIELISAAMRRSPPSPPPPPAS